MDISNMIEDIIETGSKGKELLKDSFIIGLAWGRQVLIDNSELQLAIRTLSSLNHKIEKSIISIQQKEDKLNEFLNNLNYKLFNIPRLENSQQQPFNNQQQSPFKNQQQQSPFKNNLSPQKTLTKNVCQLCNFNFDSSKPTPESDKVIISNCQHQFHLLCLCLQTQEKGSKCPICQSPLLQDYDKSLFLDLFESYKSCCPNLECSNSFLYFGQDIFDCQQCHQQWCLKCKRQYHNNTECILEIDHYNMSLGQKYKYCTSCKKILYIRNLDKNNQQIPKHC